MEGVVTDVELCFLKFGREISLHRSAYQAQAYFLWRVRGVRKAPRGGGRCGGGVVWVKGTDRGEEGCKLTEVDMVCIGLMQGHGREGAVGGCSGKGEV